MSHGLRGILALSWFLATGCAATIWPEKAYAPDVSMAEFRYGELDRCLQRYVNEDGRVDYAALAEGSEALDRFYAQAAAISPESHPELFPTKEHELAYWINAYNAAVLKVVLTTYPIESVNDVRPPAAHFFIRTQGAGFFYFKKVILGGRKTNLFHLERELILVRYPEPRSHFALNCASIGCPSLPREHFDPVTLDEELTREARRFFADERNLRVDHDQEKVLLSRILEWYESDFTTWMAEHHPERPATLVEYAALYADEGTAAELRGKASGYAVEFMPYDWGLNQLAAE